MASEYCIVADVLERLRLPPTHPDAPYIGECTTAACELIDDRLSVLVDDVLTPPEPPYPRRLWRAAIGVATDVYRLKDRDADTSGTWSTAPAPAPRIPNNVLERYAALIDGDRHVWGIG